MKKRQKILEMIRVNHAGEFGAKQIYSGQIKVFKAKRDQDMVNEFIHMRRQEDVHFSYFDQKIKDNQIRPTIMQPIWKIGGFSLGAITAMMGKKAAMTCTMAVEEVIDDHYKSQLKDLGDDKDQKELSDKIEQFRQEEVEHRDIGEEYGAKDFIFHKPLSRAIKNLSKLAIFISKKY
jgi:ubiquinone biosynthesis monooxygenase Coq7